MSNENYIVAKIILKTPNRLMSTFWDQMLRFKPMQIKTFHILEAYIQQVL